MHAKSTGSNETRTILVRRALPAALLLLVAFGGATAGGSWSFLAITGMVTGFLLLSTGMLFGRLDLLTLCPATFAGIAVFAVMWCGQRFDLPFVVGLLVGTVGAAPVGALIGIVAIRVRGEYLAVLTFAFAVAVSAIIDAYGFPGQISGESADLRRPPGFTTDGAYFLLVLALLVLVGWGLDKYTNTSRGRSWALVKSSERGAAASGRHVSRVKIEAFAISAAIAGMAGALQAYQSLGNVTTTSFSPLASMSIVAFAVLLASDNLSGAVIGGVLAAAIPEILQSNGLSPVWMNIVFGVGAVASLMNGKTGMSSTLPWRVRRSSTATSEPPRDTMASQVLSSDRPSTLTISGLSVSYGGVQH